MDENPRMPARAVVNVARLIVRDTKGPFYCQDDNEMKSGSMANCSRANIAKMPENASQVQVFEAIMSAIETHSHSEF